MSRRIWLVRSLIAVFFVLGIVGVSQAQSNKSFYWDRMDVDITVQENSDLHIVETWEATFTRGEFRFAYRDIPTDRLTGISNVAVSEGDRQFTHAQTEAPYTFLTTTSGGKFRIEFFFPPTSDSTHTFVISYTVHGALRIYEGGDQVWWKAVFPDRTFAVNSARVTVNLPPAATADVVESYGAPATHQVVGQRQVVFTSTEPIPGGQELEVRVQFPHGIVQGQSAGWQAAEDRKPVINLIALAAGILALTGGIALLVLLWYMRGRDKPVGLVAEYLTDPPSDLAPGLVGTLIDEKADMKDIIATLVNLGHKGVITMREEQSSGFAGFGTRHDFTFELVDTSQTLLPHEKMLVESMFKSKTQVDLSDLKNKFYKSVSALQSQLYDEVVEAGMFKSSPQTTRRMYSCLGFLLLAGGVASLFLFASLLMSQGELTICPLMSIAAVGVGVLIVGNFMPRRTKEGATANAQWKAFRRYLENIEKYAELEKVKDTFDKYLPYAIAFGIDKSWVNKFEKIDTPAPPWFIPWGVPYMGGGYGRVAGRSAPMSTGGEGGGMPSLDQAAGRMSTSLNAMSVGLVTMLNSTASTMTSQPRSSGGGGFSGGGFSGGGGGGGGGGGFG